MTSTTSLLRTRGGISTVQVAVRALTASSPHTRRYFQVPPYEACRANLFSAHAEVFPSWPLCMNQWVTLLRTRGGISHERMMVASVMLSSPHTRRYFHQHRRGIPGAPLFSAHAEVFPNRPRPPPIPAALLRTRGGISPFRWQRSLQVLSSPHTRRYFQLRKARRNIRGESLLRTRGGISESNFTEQVYDHSSPHTRRYFHDRSRARRNAKLFSAHAEVFPRRP